MYSNFTSTEENYIKAIYHLQQPNAIRFTVDGASLPAHVSAWIDAQEASVVTLSSADELMSIGLRARPRFVVFDARRDPDPVLAAVQRVKRDSYTAVVPCAVLCSKKNEALSEAFVGTEEAAYGDLTQAERRELLRLVNKAIASIEKVDHDDEG